MINGQKIFTSLASDADYIWLATRTDPDAPKHGASRCSSSDDGDAGPPRSIEMDLLSDHNICTYFDDVRVPAELPGGRREPGLEAHHRPAQPRARHDLLAGHARGLPISRRCSLGAQTKRCPTGRRVIDQEWVQTQPGARLRRPRVPAADQLEGGLDEHPGEARRGRRVVDQGLRHRVLPRGLPPADGGHGTAGLPEARTPEAVQGQARDALPQPADPHLRRRHQRDPARPDRHVRSGRSSPSSGLLGHRDSPRPTAAPSLGFMELAGIIEQVGRIAWPPSRSSSATVLGASADLAEFGTRRAEATPGCLGVDFDGDA